MLVAALGLVRQAAAQDHRYVPPSTDLVVGQPVTVQMPSGSPDTLRVTYRPSSAIAKTDTLPSPGESLDWTPRAAGVVQLASGQGASQDVTVQFQSFPVSGIVILLGAALILFGGAALAFWALFAPERRA